MIETSKNNYTLGIIGALVGGLVATIPWVVCYVYMEMIFSIFAVFVALAALKGYELMKGKTNKYTWIIIAVISIICIVFATYVIIPLLMLFNEGMDVNISNLKTLYQYKPFMDTILKDCAISIFFTIIGISGVISELRKKHR